MNIVERILCRLFPHVDIYRTGTTDLYLRRWFIYPRMQELTKPSPRIYLHKFYRGDDDPYLHTHPWQYSSLILTRGYWEETPLFNPSGTPDRRKGWPSLIQVHREEPVQRRVTFYPRFSLLHRPAAWAHRVLLEGTKPVWTIVLTGMKEKSWGFWVNNELCPHQTFARGVEWCGADQTDPST